MNVQMRKYHLIISVLSALILASCDNYDISDQQADSFIKYYGVGREDEGIRVITTDEGYLVMGNIDNPNRGKDICIIRTDKFGNSSEPIRTYGGLFDDYGYAIKPHDDGYIIAGSTQTAENSYKDVYLLQISSDGDLIWDSIYGYSMDDEARDVLVLGNGHLIVTGYSYSPENGNKDFLFLETDHDGTQVKIKTQGIPDKDDEAYAIVQSNKFYMLAGYTYRFSAQYSQSSKSISIIRWAGEGSPDPNPPFNLGTESQVQSILTTGINEYYLACNVQGSQTGESSVYILKIDTLWNVIWQKSFGERLRNQVSDFSIRNNELFVCGTSTDAELSGDLWIFRTSLEGENTRYYYAGDGVSFLGKGFDFTDDGGYIITGANISEKSIITLCKLNAEGEIQ
jgi:hypothetical protein